MKRVAGQLYKHSLVTVGAAMIESIRRIHADLFFGLNLPPEYPEEKAWDHLILNPEIASFNCGSVNHGEKPFINSPATARKLAKNLIDSGIKPEIEIYHSGIINEALTLYKSGLLTKPMIFSFAMGIHGGVTATCKNLLNIIDNLPPDSHWSVIGIGASQLPLNIYAILLGGHVRTGLEDNIYYHKGELATSSAQLVKRVVRISKETGREIATPEDSRNILNLG